MCLSLYLPFWNVHVTSWKGYINSQSTVDRCQSKYRNIFPWQINVMSLCQVCRAILLYLFDIVKNLLIRLVIPYWPLLWLRY